MEYDQLIKKQPAHILTESVQKTSWTEKNKVTNE